MTNAKFGLNLFGSTGLRVYNNTFSSGDILSLLTILTSSNTDITSYITGKLDDMSDGGLTLGADVSILNFMMYMKFQKFSLGFSMLPKTTGSGTIGKTFFSTIFQNLSLYSKVKFDMNLFMMQYLDFNFNLSTRAEFLEKHIPVDAIYVGITSHAYVPTLYFNFNGDASLSPGSPDSSGFYTYDFDINGSVNMATNYGIAQALGLVPTVSTLGLTSMISNSGTAAFGLGWDMGFIIQFNKIFRYGFSITDLGFLVYPTSASKSLNINATINPLDISSFSSTFATEFQTALSGDYQKSTTAVWFMPGTAIRTGIGITPIHRKNLDIILAADIALTDLNNLLLEGYPTFNFATGIEFTPKAGWAEFPMRTAFSYNSQVNSASFSFGLGLYLGPVQFEIALKGLEFLIKNWGTKEIAFGTDFKFEF